MHRPAVLGATELLDHSATGRRFAASRHVRLGDVDTAGRLRLDATARYLQDIATDAAADAGLDDHLGWLVRRTLTAVERPAVLGEAIELTTSCTGIGRSWAERRTTLAGDRGAVIESVSVWVQVDVATGRPTRLTEQFTEIYGEACAGRAVSARLTLAGPTPGLAPTRWAVRRTDLDPFDHVNNAANWAFLEEAVGEFASRAGIAEMEFLAPVDLRSPVELLCRTGPADASTAADVSAWLVSGGQVLSAARWRPGR